jgi:hypothetical protein
MSAQQSESLKTEPAEVDAFYLFGCMTLWRKTGNIQAGWELIRALASPDANIRSMTEAVLELPKRPGRLPVFSAVYVW